MVARPTPRGRVAPFVFGGPINRAAFETGVARVPAAELRPGDIVVMDNPSSRKGASMRALFEAAGAELRRLPPCRPDFDPPCGVCMQTPAGRRIDNAVAKLEALLRKALERTVEGLWTAVGRIADAFTPAECANRFDARGYDPNW